MFNCVHSRSYLPSTGVPDSKTSSFALAASFIAALVRFDDLFCNSDDSSNINAKHFNAWSSGRLHNRS